MLSLATAIKLKDAGLHWEPSLHDFFIVPVEGLDKRTFVLSNVMSYVEIVQGRPAVTFHGAVEWALDFVFVGDVIWLPTEQQLREMVEQRLRDQTPPRMSLISTADGYRCEIRQGDGWHIVEGFGASEAYAQALLFLMRQ